MRKDRERRVIKLSREGAKSNARFTFFYFSEEILRQATLANAPGAGLNYSKQQGERDNGRPTENFDRGGT